ncbi:MAG: Sapep family Mn(2+)-dependent dipeptidase [Clostridia bacterium]|nr:Sapep family Mn(2+)-dependent dipeptidase [Clostridia bacterium]MDD4797916.1 Sapep family Mn(2+)-dependent dipeptidase [Clostridia bacterium]
MRGYRPTKEHLIKYLDNHYNKLEDAVCHLLSLPSVLDETTASKDAPFGYDLAVTLEHFLAEAQGLGFRARNLEGYLGFIDFGPESAQTVGILGHLDVVPVGEGWTKKPFGGQIFNDKIYGRGAVDDKAPLVACLYAMSAIKELGMPIKKKIRLIAGCDEETDFRCINYYKKQGLSIPDYGFSPDAEFPLIFAEKQIIHCTLEADLPDYGLEISCGNAVNMVPGSATVKFISPYWLRKTKAVRLKLDKNNSCLINGRTAHASTPSEGKNAAKSLLAFLAQNADSEQFKNICRTLLQFAPDNEFQPALNALGLGLEDETGILTCCLTMLSLKNNHLSLSLDVRFPISGVSKSVKAQIEAIGARAGLQMTSYKYKDGLLIEKDSELIKKLLSAYSEISGEKNPAPIAIGGGTYARALENFCAFGPAFPGGGYPAHQPDEFISRADLLLLSKIYALAICNLAQ